MLMTGTNSKPWLKSMRNSERADCLYVAAWQVSHDAPAWVHLLQNWGSTAVGAVGHVPAGVTTHICVWMVL
jgi:hypothetical protein